MLLRKYGEATLHHLSNINHTDHGWMIIERNGKKILIPVWNTEDTMTNLDRIRKAVLKKCNCQKSGCRTAASGCTCKKSASFCSNLCTCSNCANREIDEAESDEDKSDVEDESSSTDIETADEEEKNEIDYGDFINQNRPCSSLVEKLALMDVEVDDVP